MELESQILSTEYSIQNFENLRPEANPFRDSITAYWSGFYHEANRLPDPNIDEEVMFFKFRRKAILYASSTSIIATASSQKKMIFFFQEEEETKETKEDLQQVKRAS